MKTDWWRGRAIKLAGVVAVAVAVLGVRFAFEVGEGTWYGRLLEEVAFALLIAALLGLSIDYLLKHDLVEDSFKAAIGYLLPEELRPEMAWINGLTLLATSYRADYELRRLPNDASHVVVRERIERHIKNITKSRQPIEPSTGTGEWFYPKRRSRVTSWFCTIGGQT